MGVIIKLISVAGVVSAVLLSLFCLGSGLYILSTWIEDNARITKKILEYLSMVVASIHILLLIFDGFPILNTLYSMVCIGIYSLLLNTFPIVNMLSFTFLGSILFAVGNHFVWFFYFVEKVDIYSYAEISSFMGVCVWFLPILYFISLDSSENTLPSYDSSGKSKRRQNIFQSLVSKLTGTNTNKNIENAL
ncbi:hypothetical protein BB558_003417 [Smittium angustum]|uniref:Transmembrane adaptor Erv26 n=1 Tax=Smittium angustum TaxID=133377 RepID=A0A2U1J651_SMIAN|nr:hypothetical protein BB558_003417 [Smittium angustum]